MLSKKTTKIVYYFMKSESVRCPVYAVWLCSQDQLLFKPYCCLHLLWIAGDQMILFHSKKGLKIDFLLLFCCYFFQEIWQCALLFGSAVKINCFCKPYCCLHWLWIAGDQTILFSMLLKNKSERVFGLQVRCRDWIFSKS